MHILLSFLASLFLVSCSVESKKEKCVYNGRQIDCKDMPRGQAPVVNSLKGTVLTATIQTAIAHDSANKKFEIIENSFDSASASEGSQTVNCGAETQSGQIVKYVVNDRSAEFVVLNERLRLKKLAGDKNSILGQWTSKVAKNGIEKVFKINILDTSMKIELICTVL